MSAVTKYLAAIGRRGGKAGKGSAAKAASAKKANAVRWEKHRKSKRVPAKPNGSTACITRVGRSPDGKAFVVYLRDGMKISVGRDKRTKGPAWLEVKEQSKLVAQ